MNAADLFTGTLALRVMNARSRYLPFMVNRDRDKVSTQDETHLGNSPLGPEAPDQRNPPGRASVSWLFSAETVNPSHECIVQGAGVGVTGDRGRVFTKNTKMQKAHTLNRESASNSLVNRGSPRSALYKCAYTPRRGFTLRRPPVDALPARKSKGERGYRRVERGGRGVVGGSVSELVDPHPRTPPTRMLVQSAAGSVSAETAAPQRTEATAPHTAVRANRQGSKTRPKCRRKGGVEGSGDSTPPFDACHAHPTEDLERGEAE